MSIFRPAAKVTAPDGQEWEIFAYRVAWRKPPRLRDTWRSFVAAARAARSDAWTIAAVSYRPRPTVYTWTTRTEHRGQVLAAVERSVARGDIPIRLAKGPDRGQRRS